MNFALNNNKQQWLRNFSSEKLQTYTPNRTHQIETDNHITALNSSEFACANTKILKFIVKADAGYTHGTYSMMAQLNGNNNNLFEYAPFGYCRVRRGCCYHFFGGQIHRPAIYG